MTATQLRSPSVGADTAARGIRDVINVMMNDLETIRRCAGVAPGCADAVRRLVRQVNELERLADELHLPPG